MEQFYYAHKDTLFFAKVSDRLLDPSNLIRVDSLPPDKNYKWSLRKREWIPLSAEEVAQVNLEESSIDLRNGRVLQLNNLSSLKKSDDYKIKEELDILYYKNTNPIQKKDFIYTTKKGYLLFPQLSWARGEQKTVSFIVYFGDIRYTVFGIASELYNFASNDYNKLEIGLRFRNYYGCYYQYGLTAQGKNGFAYQGYERMDSLSYYRIDITGNGDHGEVCNVYLLPDGKFEGWGGGHLVQTIDLADFPARKGKILYPYVGEYFGSNNGLLGVAIS